MTTAWFGASPGLDANNASSQPVNAGLPYAPPQLALLDMFFPGFSTFTAAVQRYTLIDLNVYIPVVLLAGGASFLWQYISEFAWSKLESYFMSTCTIRTDDETFNYMMAWVAKQSFSQKSRRFIVNTNTNSRSWFTWRWSSDDDEDDEHGGEEKKKPLSYTPTFGSHYFFYKGRLLIFHRSQNKEQATFLVVSEREEITLSCLGRNPAILKELLMEARDLFLKRDEKKTAIYRGTNKAGTAEPSWQRCMARTSRPFSTVILNEKTKQELIDDVTDYLDPATRRWYANRGIPYRRGYLLHGPPGTGKSSLSLALAGFFKMRIYIVSLSSIHASEENLSSLFAELPRRCVVLLEDIDTAGLTHTREENTAVVAGSAGASDMVPGQVTPGAAGTPVIPAGRLSLSGLLNILDGVASQEGRVLIMTTNHVEKLDKALIRPGRVDMIVNFDRADGEMVGALFRAIYAPLEGDDEPEKVDEKAQVDPEAVARKNAEAVRKREEAVNRVRELSEQFSAKVPGHEFSPAELQGYLMKNKRDPEAAVKGVDDWVVNTRKEKKEKELQEAEDKRKKEEEERKEAEEKKKKEEEEKKEAEEKEKKEKEKEARKKKRKQQRKERESKKSRKSKKAEESDASSGEDDDSSSSEDEEEPANTAATKKDKTEKETTADATTTTSKTPEESKESGNAAASQPEKTAAEKSEKDDGAVKATDGKTDSGYET